MSFRVNKDVALGLRKFKQRIEKEKRQAFEWNDVMEEFLKAVQEKPKKTRKSKKTKITRAPSAQEKRKVEEKYNGCCAFTDCNKPVTQLHHPDRFAINKSHKRLVPLCDCHHEIAHNGLIGNEDEPPETWYIKERANKNHPKFKIDQKFIQHKMAAFVT